jgi:SHS2 domain-containing protein
VCKRVEIVKFDRENWKIQARGFGEVYDKAKHVPGTEIKAITYSAMQILEKEGKAEVYVIVDI